MGNEFHLDVGAEAREEDETEEVENVGSAKVVCNIIVSLTIDLQVNSRAHNWWEPAEVLTKSVHHEEGADDGGSNTLNLLVNFLTEVECSNSGDDYQTHLDFAIESSDW